MMPFLKKNMVVIGVVVVALAAGYYFYSSSGAAPLLSDTPKSDSPISEELLTTLSNLRTITLDDSIFRDPLFASLSDFGVSIPPAAAGRRNPFAPVGQSGAASQTTAPASTATTTAATSTAH